MVFVNLDGIAAAHGDVGLGLAMQIGELVLHASAALEIALYLHGLKMAGPNVAGDQAAMESPRIAGEELDGFGGLQGGDEIDDRAEDADGIAGFLHAREGIRCAEETSEAGGVAGENGHGEAVSGDGCGVNPRAGGLDGEIVHQEAGFEVVGAVENDVEALQQIGGVLRIEIGDEAFDGNGGIDGFEPALGGDGFGEGIARVGLVEKSLALQIGRFDEIAIEDSNAAYAGTDQEAGGSSANGAAANDYGAGGEEALLALEAESLKKYLPRVFFLKKFIHDFSGPGGFRERARICDDSAKHDRTGNAAVLRFV
jgi:hypothetical protein